MCSNSEATRVKANIRTLHDVQQLLRQFGTIIYTGDVIGDLELMDAELRELFLEWRVITDEQFHQALGVLRRERERRQ